ncbi:hypothetical protein AXF42_Ash017549 [Apostasia shenzhenica]|uniref:Ternary complex factor MIP1 leucine-zipper domain-containing protein n=1 Tax=Apostasia shenzhenica TaxID=1088818 RepID=A0A2I0A398_9ASPA|nr:hypothetical protein AXF42_Ash017549 [Apostasia shenzhenica]
MNHGSRGYYDWQLYGGYAYAVPFQHPGLYSASYNPYSIYGFQQQVSYKARKELSCKKAKRRTKTVSRSKKQSIAFDHSATLPFPGRRPMFSRGLEVYDSCSTVKEIEKEKKTEVVDARKLKESGNFPKRLSRRERKIALEQDVDKLRKKLRHEENVHRALERAFTRPLGALPRLPPYLPSYTLELLAEVAVLEEEVVRLEEQVVNFRQGLYKEAIYISSSKKNSKNGIQLSCDSSSTQIAKDTEQNKSHSQLANSKACSISSSSPSMHWLPDRNPNISSSKWLTNVKQLPKKPISSLADSHRGKENQTEANSTKNTEQSPVKNAATHCDSKDTVSEEASGPNKLSEEILRCLLHIFTLISLPKKIMAVDSDTVPSVSGSYNGVENIEYGDPYNICVEFGKRDIGPYGCFREVNANTTDMNLISKFLFQARRLKLLLRKLASVDIVELSHQQKLAFWINIYNSCMMNAFLENGIPTTPEMLVSLMSKATANVGGHLFSAMTIEHFILRLPYHSKQAIPKGLKGDEMSKRSLFGLDWPEPLVSFALSCGSWSSPAVRIYTASEVEKQLEGAKRDYLQAAVGVSKPNRLAIPKLLDWYMVDFAKDMDSLMDWICLQLPNELRNDAVKCLEMGRSANQSIRVLPFDFRFRYLLAS